MFKKFVSEYLIFTKKERIAVIILVFSLAFVFFSPSIYGFVKPSRIIQTDSAWVNEMKLREIPADSQVNSQEKANYVENNHNGPTTQQANGTLFNFDPNKISREQWLQLGVREKTAGTILNYLEKGGRFRKPEDLQKIYGFRKEEYVRLLPYIQIENPEKSGNSNPATEVAVKDEKPKASFSIKDINAADTSDFIKLPGIGSKLASRIVNFRDKLGGFYSIEQVKETYGIADSVFKKIQTLLNLGNTQIRKININTATSDEMKMHPYLKSELSRVIIAYRKEHGNFTKIEDVKKIVAITDAIFQKVSPYLSIQ